MTEEQAKIMIVLLNEISSKLTDISAKISSDYGAETIGEKLDDVVRKLGYIETNTSDI